MTAILEKNLSSFLQRYPAQSEFFNSVDFDKIVQNFKLQESGGHLELFKDGQRIDTTDPSIYMGYQAPDHPVKIAVINGFGLGGLFQNVVNSLSGLDYVVVVEPDAERFLFSLSQTDFGSIFENEKYFWIVGRAPEESFPYFFEILRKIPTASRMKASFVFNHPLMEQRTPGAFQRIEEEWRTAIRQVMRGMGHLEDSLIGLRNIYQNKELMQSTPGIMGFKDLFQCLPAVIVGAGPSLTKSLPQLKSLQGSCIILSSDATASILEEEGISPHFVLTLERGITSKGFFDKLKEVKASSESILVAYPMVMNEVIEAFPGKKCVCYRDYSYFLFFQEDMPRGILPSSSSVTHMATRFADYLGCSKICLIGQDLSYDPKTLQSHARNISYREWTEQQSLVDLNKKLKESEQGQVILIPGNYEEVVPSNATYFSMLKEFSWEASQVSAEVVNCTEGGASIPNIRLSTLAEESVGWSAFNDDSFAQIHSHRGEPSEKVFNWNRLRARISDLGKRLTQLELECGRLMKDKSRDMQLHSKAIQMLRSAQEALSKDPLFLAFVVEADGLSYLEAENEWHMIPQSSNEPEVFYKALHSWFKAMNYAVHRVGECIS